MSQCVTLPNGQKMPLVGLGTWQITKPEDLETALDTALSLGYRHIDTAYRYQNQEIVGRVLKKWLDSGKVKREELFIVAKLPSIGMSPERVGYFTEKEVKSLQLDYVDLYLIHGPIGVPYIDDNTMSIVENGKVITDKTTNLEEVWKAMEEQVDKGLAKSIGISKFSSGQIERIMKIARIPPANCQVEIHAYCQQKPLRETCKKFNITVCGFSPLGSPGSTPLLKQRIGKEWEPLCLLEDPVVGEIAKAHGKTPAQILLRFLVQQDIVVIPKSSNPERIKSNFEVFDFSLNDTEMDRLSGLDKGAEGQIFSFKNIYKGAEDHPEYVHTYG